MHHRDVKGIHTHAGAPAVRGKAERGDHTRDRPAVAFGQRLKVPGHKIDSTRRSLVEVFIAINGGLGAGRSERQG